MDKKSILEQCVVTFSRGTADFHDGVVAYEKWRNQNGEYHRPTDDPAITIRCLETSKILEKRYYQNGRLSRKDKPAVIIKSDSYLTKEWWLNGLEHRDESDGPSMREVYLPSGLIVAERWMQQGIANRNDGPQNIRREPDNGITVYEEYRVAGRPAQRGGLPYYITRDENTAEIIAKEYAETSVNPTNSMEPG